MLLYRLIVVDLDLVSMNMNLKQNRTELLNFILTQVYITLNSF